MGSSVKDNNICYTQSIAIVEKPKCSIGKVLYFMNHVFS
jgi:hypothetical protein